MESAQKTVFISGGTSGIGLAAAEILLKRGWTVAVSGRSAERGKAALDYLNAGSRAVYMSGDVGNDEDCRRMIGETVRQFGRLDGLVTSAGYYEECLLEYTDDEQVRKMFAVNVYGTISLCRYALPYLKKTCGSIVTVSSDAGLQGNVACSVYGATKGAVVAFSKSLALEAAPHQVRVNCVCPGDVETPLLEKQLQGDPSRTIESMKEQYPLYRLAKPQEVGIYMSEEMKTVEQLQEEIAKLKQELADLKSSQAPAQEAEPVAAADQEIPGGESEMALQVLQTIEQSTDDVDVKVETLCRWAAARAGAIVVAPLLGTVALMANEVYLVSRIARIYNVKLTERALIAFLGAVGSRMIGTLLTTLIPFSVIQVPVAVGITYSLGRVTQRWMKDGMPSDMTPYVEMMGEWKDKAREQVDRLRENPLKNVPLGDETVDFIKRWGGTAAEKFQDVKEKGQELYHNVRHKDDLVEEIIEEKAAEDAAKAVAAETAAEAADDAAEQAAAAETTETEKKTTVEEQVKAAVEDAKIPLD